MSNLTVKLNNNKPVKKSDPIYIRIGDVIKPTNAQLKRGRAGKNGWSKCEQAKFEIDAPWCVVVKEVR